MNSVNTYNNVSFDKLAQAYPAKTAGASASALKGSMSTQKMIHSELQQMMKDLTPHLGQTIDVEA